MTRNMKVVAFSCPPWLIEDLDLMKSGNKSDRIQELLIKGYMTEMKLKAQEAMLDPQYAEGIKRVLAKKNNRDKSVVCEFLTPNNQITSCVT